MTEAVWELGGPRGLESEAPVGQRARGQGGAFLERLKDALLEVDRDQKLADAAVVGFASGQGQDLHSVALAMKKAELSFRFMLAVRQKAMDAYQELARLNV